MAYATLTTKCWGETYGVRGDFAQASCPIQTIGEDGEWSGTQYQVADYRHRMVDALRAHLRDVVEMGGNSLDPDDDRYDEDVADEVKRAIERAILSYEDEESDEA